MAPIPEVYPPLLHIETISQYIALPPASLATPLPSLCASIFSPLLLSYYPPARGIVLSYSNVKLSDQPPAPASKKRKSRHASHHDSSEESVEEREENVMLRVVDEYSAVYFWATADFLVFRPRRGEWIEGHVIHQSSSHITLSHLNAFSLSILRNNLPESWTFQSSSQRSPSPSPKGKKDGRREEEASGYWVDGDGIPIGDTLMVRIREVDMKAGKGSGKGFFRIEGSMLTDEEEKAKSGNGGRRSEKRGRGILREEGSVDGTNGEVMKVD
ncbi:hypothetical protein K469DRAFT_576963 [Zopfia rhizophila CBS 207.26]|uniref:DNA-directed RNA polymerase subunit n=1 Tax=Zopfia rhizophila CBS 207.26 TaxID=1314779 RepID=A0A6A6E555_9PEZI|nr:hypothetical protein K469DRAFT_576963 [Zopfia rhizophila CBS 207.26]